MPAGFGIALYAEVCSINMLELSQIYPWVNKRD